MAHNGWRMPTPELSAAEKHAEAGERLSIPRNRAMLAIKKVATDIGLKPADRMLLDVFSGFTKEQDWEQGRRPIVWASNNYLMEHTGFSLTTLRRHIRHLVNVGLIAFKDSTNGKRWGHRDDQGYIINAHGFDLSPLAARTEEFEGLYARIQEDRRICLSLKQKITIIRRIVRAKLDTAVEKGLTGPWEKLTESFELLLCRLPKRNESAEKLLDTLDWFASFKDQVEQAFEKAFQKPQDDNETRDQQALSSVSNSTNMAPRGASSGTHILFTNQADPVPRNIDETRRAGQASSQTPPSVEDDSSEMDIDWGIGGSRKLKTEVEVSTVMAACPSFAETARDLGGGYIRDWNEFHRAAGKIRPIAGVSEDAWNVAQKVLGPLVAAAAIALIYDKHTAGEVNSPGGYLRGMVEKAKAGELHLERSLYGRMNENRAVH